MGRDKYPGEMVGADMESPEVEWKRNPVKVKRYRDHTAKQELEAYLTAADVALNRARGLLRGVHMHRDGDSEDDRTAELCGCHVKESTIEMKVVGSISREELWQRTSFPIQASLGQPETAPFRIPMVMAEKAFETYKKLFGGAQTFERLGERGGFGWSEFCMLFCGGNPVGATEEMVANATHTAAAALAEIVRSSQ